MTTSVTSSGGGCLTANSSAATDVSLETLSGRLRGLSDFHDHIVASGAGGGGDGRGRDGGCRVALVAGGAEPAGTAGSVVDDDVVDPVEVTGVDDDGHELKPRFPDLERQRLGVPRFHNDPDVAPVVAVCNAPSFCETP